MNRRSVRNSRTPPPHVTAIPGPHSHSSSSLSAGGPLIEFQSEPNPAAEIRLDAPFRPKPVLEDGGDQNPSPFVIVPPVDLAVHELETDAQPPSLLDA